MEHRLWLHGQEFPIGFDTQEVLVGLVDSYGANKVLFVEDMNMNGFIGLCIASMKAGIHLWDGTCPIAYREGEYYIGSMIVTELDVRRQLQIYYKENEDVYDIDKSYIERKAREQATV